MKKELYFKLCNLKYNFQKNILLFFDLWGCRKKSMEIQKKALVVLLLLTHDHFSMSTKVVQFSIRMIDFKHNSKSRISF